MHALFAVPACSSLAFGTHPSLDLDAVRVGLTDALDDRSIPFVSVPPFGKDRCRIFEFGVLCGDARPAAHVSANDEVANAICCQALRDVPATNLLF